MGYFIQSNHGFVGNSEELARVAMMAANGLFLPGDHDKINERLIRYYVTEGLVTRPTRIGRDAEYGYLQLLQFLASRFLVEQGYPLAKVAPYIQSLEHPQLEDLVVHQHKPNLAELLVAAYKNPSSKSEPPRISMHQNISSSKRSLKDFLEDDDNEIGMMQPKKKLINSEEKRLPQNIKAELSPNNFNMIEAAIQEINHQLYLIKQQMKRQQMDVHDEMRQLQQAIEKLTQTIHQAVDISNERLMKVITELKLNEQRQAQEISLLDEKINLIQQNSLQKNAQRSAGDDK